MTVDPTPSRKKILVLWNHPDEDEGAAPLRARSAHMAAVVAALEDAGYDAVHVNIADDIDRIIDSVVVEKPALIYNQVDSMYGDFTQHAAVASLYDLLGVAYTGSDPLCLASAAHLDRAYTLLRAAGLPVPDVAADPENESEAGAVAETGAAPDGNGDGDRDREATTKPPPAPEAEPDYRLLHVIAFADPETPPMPITESLGVHEVEPPAVIAELPDEVEARARELARRAFSALGCRDAAQIDLSLEESGLYVAEVCPVIDVAPGLPFAVAADATNRGYAGAVVDLARLALRRLRPAKPEAEAEVEPQAEIEPATASPATADAPDGEDDHG